MKLANYEQISWFSKWVPHLLIVLRLSRIILIFPKLNIVVFLSLPYNTILRLEMFMEKEENPDVKKQATGFS